MARGMETGETAASIRRRGDAARWPEVLSALRDGAHLVRFPGLPCWYVQGLDSRDKRQGLSLTRDTVAVLDQTGVLIVQGVSRFILNPDWKDPAEGMFGKSARQEGDGAADFKALLTDPDAPDPFDRRGPWRGA